LDNWLVVNTKYSEVNRSFEWSLIRSFLAAMEHGSLLGAARALGSTQPTVGRHIAELESQLGVTLFERTGRGVLPSPMAIKIAEGARSMEAAAYQLSRSVSGAESDIAGSIRITASEPVACGLLPSLLAQMRLALPEVQVELVASDQVTNLLRREADIAVRMVQPEQNSLISKRIGKVEIAIYAHRDYLRRRGTPRQLAELLSHDLIGGDRDENILRGFAAMGYFLTREHFVLRTDNLMAQWQAVRGGIGIGFISSYMARSDPSVVPLLPALKIPPLPMWLAVHREIRGSARIRAVYDFLAQGIPKAL
jgi:DNA-binding transcriptional LysR family regulator